MSIPSLPFSISPIGDGEPSFIFLKEDLLINRASSSWDVDVEVYSNLHADVCTSIPSFIPPRPNEGTST